MKDFLQYIFYSGICLAIFWMVYHLLLRANTFFTLNRVFLLTGLLLSFVLPAFVISYEVLIPASVVPQHAIATGNNPTAPSSVDIWMVAAFVYIGGILLIVFRNLRSYRRMYLLAREGQHYEYGRYTVVNNESVESPFTIFDRILLSTSKLSDFEKDLILKHEIVHIDQKHWFDLVCSECALLLQWFNPFVWLYVSSIKENHEFQADCAVLAGGVSPTLYQAVLVNQRFQGPVFSFANSFSLSNKSNRLSMIKKEKSKSWKRAAVLTVLPLLGVFFWVSAKPYYVLDITDGVVNAEQSADTTKVKRIDIKVLGAKGENFVMSNIPAHGTPIQIELSDSADIGTHVLVADSTHIVVFNNVSNQKERPLLIVDGKEFDFDKMNNIPPSEIESMEVLKDESATKIYGDKGKDGVIIITKKKK